LRKLGAREVFPAGAVRLVGSDGKPVLLDKRGEPARALTEVQELDAPTQRYVVWVDPVIDGQARGHAFVFLSYSVAAEAERDLRRQLQA
jgi:hypothetical protein